MGEQFGPAVTHINFDCYFGRGVLIQSILPLEPMLHKVVNVFYTEKKWVEPIAKMWLLGEKQTFSGLRVSDFSLHKLRFSALCGPN